MKPPKSDGNWFKSTHKHQRQSFNNCINNRETTVGFTGGTIFTTKFMFQISISMGGSCSSKFRLQQMARRTGK
ncbi:hypothetical protein HanXRQr2_Chr15g0693881 [Helianthus annuus]|uniref:Uncharacterized protein n=1 Tax=Helianthus annuus TaxID=4232 RepID=A0A251S8P1_HELAN|nr:hypothetical protein HanXRQr2_Chr15g0693881 [Helianthus annuus]KAJ0831323.1 hypothetical protein HanPSC8_Chr15g0665751 [Helianthus annuus]